MGCFKPSTQTVYHFVLTVTVLCLHDILCQATDLQYTIEEEIPSGVFIGNVANDANLADKYGFTVLEELRYSFLQGQGHNKDISEILSIEEDSGIIRTATWIDRESLCQQRQECFIKVDVAVTPSDYFEIITVQVEIRDSNDHAPEFPSQEIAREMSELAPVGSRINLPIANDQDSAEFGVDTYQLLNPSPVFDLEVNDLGSGVTSVELVLKETLDREVVDFYQLTLLALDKGTSTINTGSMLINITVVDGNDHRPYFRNDTYSISVPENYPANRSIIRVEAYDADIGSNGLITYSFAPGTDNQVKQTFGIDSETGEIYVKGQLDYEAQVSYNLVIAARDGGDNSQPALTTVIVNVQDLNDNSPQIAVNALTASGNAQIAETSKIGAFVAHVSVVDNDAGINGEFSCSLDKNEFRLEKLQQTQYKIVTASELDREEESTYTVIVTCQDFGNPPNLVAETLVVTVLDANDHAPSFNSENKDEQHNVTFYAEISENNHVDAFVIKINATDRDEGANADITFTLRGSHSDYFSIHPKHGTIRAGNVFDYESIPRFEFQVVAADKGTPPKSSVATVEVAILDANDESPRFSRPNYEFLVEENQPIGMEIGIVEATDADSEPFNRIEYSIVPGKASQVFAIDTANGHLRTRVHLDREKYSIYHMTILATNTGASPPLSGTTEVVVTVKDQNDNAPVIDFPNKHNKTVVISNAVPKGYQVGYIRAHDIDHEKNSKLVFSISGGNEGNSFRIDSETGLITTKAKFDRIKFKSFDILISVGDHGFPQRIAVATLNITIDQAVIYDGSLSGESIMGNNNLTIVLAVAISSAVIVIVLVVAIVITKLQMQRRRQGQSKWRLHMLKLWKEDGGANKESSTDDVLDSAGMGIAGNEIPIVTTDHTMQQQQSSSHYACSKQVSFNLKKSKHAAAHENQAYVSEPAVPAVSQKMCNTNEAGVVYSVPTVEMLSPPADQSDPQTQKLWELSVKQIQAQQWLESISQDGDHQSSSSGEVSNADSGRGASEEGDNNLAAHTAGLQQPLVGILRRPQSKEGVVMKQKCTRTHSHGNGNYPHVTRQQPSHSVSHQPSSSNQSAKPRKEYHQHNLNPYVASGYQNNHNPHIADVHQRHKHLGSSSMENVTNYPQVYPRSSSRATDSSSQRHLDDSGYYGHPPSNRPNSVGCHSSKSRSVADSCDIDLYTDNASSTSGSYVLDGKDLQDMNELPPIQAVVV